MDSVSTTSNILDSSDSGLCVNMAMSVKDLLFAILELNTNLATLTGASRELARQDRDQLVERLAQVAHSNWRNHVRLTIIDSNVKFHREDIVFRNADGSEASPEDMTAANHILVMPARENYSAAMLDDVAGLVKLDQDNVEWMPIINNEKFLILRFSSGRLYLISNSFGIRALTSSGM